MHPSMDDAPRRHTLRRPAYVSCSSITSTEFYKTNIHVNSFDPTRHLRPLHSDAARTNSAFGAGAYTCLGMHLAYMELRYCTAMLFRQCKGIKLADEMGALDDGALENYFVITPKDKKLVASFESVDADEYIGAEAKMPERKDSMQPVLSF